MNTNIMEKHIAKNLKGIPAEYKVLVTTDEHLQKYILSMVKDQNLVIIKNETFTSGAPVVIWHQDKEILVKTYNPYKWHLILASETMETIDAFIENCNQKAVSEGYLLFPSSSSFD